MKIDFDRIKIFAIDNSMNSEIHGLEHWERVERNGIILAKKTGANLNVVKVFAYLHDMCRANDGCDPGHGERAALFLKNHENTILSGLSEIEKVQLYCACTHHTTALKTDDVTVNTCFDADRLDLQRVGIIPHPERMATETGSYYAENLDKFIGICENFKNNQDKPKMSTGLEFSDEPIDIKAENKLIVYRFNIGEFSPYVSQILNQVFQWDYKSKSVKTDNPEGIYALTPGEQSLGQLIFRLYDDILGNNVGGSETIVLKLEVDKNKLITDRDIEVSFRECNILDKMSIGEFMLREYSQYSELVFSANAYKSDKTELNKQMFEKMYNVANTFSTKTLLKGRIKAGLINLEDMGNEFKAFLEQ